MLKYIYYLINDILIIYYGISSILLNFFYGAKYKTPLNILNYTYTLKNENKNENQNITIYNLNNNSSKVLIFFSGGNILYYSPYIKKTIIDLIKYHPEIINQYNIYIFEKFDKSMGELFNDITQYIIDLHNINNIIELILFGFSTGGVFASHIMSKLNNYNF